MTDEYRVPSVLVSAREHRRSGTPAEGPSPSWLYTVASENTGTDTKTGALLFNHAMIEVGYILDGPKGNPYTVCPVCGYVLA